jgi:hypothetical protein
VQPIVAAASPTVKYLSQHAAEALAAVEARMRALQPAPPPPSRPSRGGAPGAPGAPKPAFEAASTTPAAPGPLSLVAAQAADGPVGRRAAALLGPWTGGGPGLGAGPHTAWRSTHDGGTGAAQLGASLGPGGLASSLREPLTLVEALSLRMSHTGRLSHTGGPTWPPATERGFPGELLSAAATPVARSPAKPVLAALPSPTPLAAHVLGTPLLSGGPLPPGLLPGEPAQGPVSGGGPVACVSVRSAAEQLEASSRFSAAVEPPPREWQLLLRYRSGAWAVPAAYLAAQLEEDFGRARVRLQVGLRARLVPGAGQRWGAGRGLAQAGRGLGRGRQAGRGLGRGRQAGRGLAQAAPAVAGGMRRALSHPCTPALVCLSPGGNERSSVRRGHVQGVHQRARAGPCGRCQPARATRRGRGRCVGRWPDVHGRQQRAQRRVRRRPGRRVSRLPEYLGRRAGNQHGRADRLGHSGRRPQQRGRVCGRHAALAGGRRRGGAAHVAGAGRGRSLPRRGGAAPGGWLARAAGGGRRQLPGAA